MKIHKHAQRRVPGNPQNTVANTQGAVLENRPVPEGDTIFLSSRTIHLPDPKGKTEPELIGREVTLKNGTQLTHDVKKKTVRMTHPENPKGAREYTNASLQLPTEDGKPLVIQNQEMEQRLFGNGGMILVDHANKAHYLDGEAPQHRGFRTDEYHIFESGSAVGRQYTKPHHNSNFRTAKHVRAWQTREGNLQVPNDEGIHNWNTLCPFVSQKDLDS